MTAAAVLARGAGVTRPSPLSQGVTVAPKGYKVVSYYADDDDRAALDALARLRFGGNKTAALRWSVALAALVASSAATYGAADPAAALAAYCKGKAK